MSSSSSTYHHDDPQDKAAPPSLPLTDPTLSSREQNLEKEAANNNNDPTTEEADSRQNNTIQSPEVSRIQTSAAEVGSNQVAVSSSSVEPESFRRHQHQEENLLNHPSADTRFLSATSPPMGEKVKSSDNNKPLFGVDPIGRLLSFNQSSNYTSSSADEGGDSDKYHTDNDHDNTTPNKKKPQQGGTPAAEQEASTTKTDNGSIFLGSPDDNNSKNYSTPEESATHHNTNTNAAAPGDGPVVVSVANRRRMAAALRAPLRNGAAPSSNTPTPSNIEAYNRYSILDDISRGADDDDETDYADDNSTFRSVSRNSMLSNNNNNNTSKRAPQFSPSSIIGELASYQSPIRGGDGGKSLVTVLEEYNVLRNCRGWLQETQTRTFHSLDSQGDQLLDWQRRRLEQQSEGILDDLAGTLNTTTIAEMYDAIAGCLDQVENVLEPNFHDKITELTSLKANPHIISHSNPNTSDHQDGDGMPAASVGSSTKALSSYVNLLSLEADRILDLSSNIHVSLDSVKADLSEARSADAAFDLDRRQSRRNFSQKISILEEESRQLKFDLRREMKVCLDRDRKTKKKFDTVHGQLEALLKGVELFDDVREDIAQNAQLLEEIVSHSIKLRMNHNHEVTAAQEPTTPSSQHANPSSSSASSPPSSPNTKEGIKFYQRVAAVSRKLRDHGYDLAAMMSPSAAKDKEYSLNADGSVKIPQVYQQSNTACFVDPSIIFATEDAKDLGAIEDIADEYFPPMAIEAYDSRREHENKKRNSNSQEPLYHDRNKNDVINHRLNRINNNDPNHSNNNSSFATPAIPVALSTKPATVDYLEVEAKRQASEILEEARKRTDAAKDYLSEARRKAAVAAGVPLLAADNDHHHRHQRQDDEKERPRLPSVAIPDSKVDSSRISPQAPDRSQSLRSATTLRDLVPAPLRTFLPREQEQEQAQEDQQNSNEDDETNIKNNDEHKQKDEDEDTSPKELSRSREPSQLSNTQRQHEPSLDHPTRPKKSSSTPASQLPSTPASKQSSRTPSVIAQQFSSAAAATKPSSYENPKRPRRNSLLGQQQPSSSAPTGDLPVSISYKVGMPFGTANTTAGEESTLPRPGGDYSRGSSVNNENDENDEPYRHPEDTSPRFHPPSQQQQKKRSPSTSSATSLTLSEARRRRKEERLREQQQQEQQQPDHRFVSPATARRDPHYSPYDDTPPRNLRGLKTPTQPNDIAYVNSANHTGTPGSTDQFYYPQQQQQNSSSKPKSNNGKQLTKQQQPQQQKKQKEVPLEDYGETPQGGDNNQHRQYPDYDDEDYQQPEMYQPPQAFFVDLSNDVDDENNGRNNRHSFQPPAKKRPAESVLKNTNVKPNKSTPKPATFSKGISNKDRPAAASQPKNRTASSSSSMPRKSHIAIPKNKKQRDDYDDHFNQGYEDDGSHDDPVVADIDLSNEINNNNNNNNNNRNQGRASTPKGFSNPDTTIQQQFPPRSNIPTWIDLMNEKTQIQSEFNPEYMDIARYRLEQDRRNNTSGIDPRDYELIPNVGLERALKNSDPTFSSNVPYNNPNGSSSNNSSKLAGIPMTSTYPSPAQSATAPIGSRPSGGGRERINSSPVAIPNSNHRYQMGHTPESAKIPFENYRSGGNNRVPSSAVPPAPRPGSANNRSSVHSPVDSAGKQEDVRRHLDRLKLDTQEAVAKMRNSPVVQGLI